MFGELTEKLERVFKKLTGRGKLTPDNIQDAMREVRRALLEADVNYKVVKKFVTQVEAAALGQSVMKSVSPGQMFIKIVHDELVSLMGGEAKGVQMASQPPTVVMMVGLQGSGKTTMCGKIARHFRHKNKKPFLIAADVYRPAAIKQLQVLGHSLSIPVFTIDGSKDVIKICQDGVREAERSGCDFVIIDTAGRLHIDEEMMQEVEKIKMTIRPHETLFVADGMTGQDAVNTAKEFHQRLDFDGVCLTKMDGDARGGAALSIREVTGKPIKYIGVGEKLDALELFHPERMATRILGMGDIVSLVEKAEQVINEEDAEKLEKKLRKGQFSLDDFLEQLQYIKKLGPLDQLIGMLPGANKLISKGAKIDDKPLKYIEAIIRAMTPEERQRPNILNGSRRKRIASGSGRSVQEVNVLMRQFDQMQTMFKKFSKMSPKQMSRMGLPF